MQIEEDSRWKCGHLKPDICICFDSSDLLLCWYIRMLQYGMWGWYGVEAVNLVPRADKVVACIFGILDLPAVHAPNPRIITCRLAVRESSSEAIGANSSGVPPRADWSLTDGTASATLMVKLEEVPRTFILKLVLLLVQCCSASRLLCAHLSLAETRLEKKCPIWGRCLSLSRSLAITKSENCGSKFAVFGFCPLKTRFLRFPFFWSLFRGVRKKAPFQVHFCSGG